MLKFPTKEFLKVIDTLERTTTRDASYFANNILANVCFNAASAKRNVTPSVSKAKIKANLNKPSGQKWVETDPNSRRRKTYALKNKHILALRYFRATGRTGQSVNFARINEKANDIVKSKVKTNSYLRAGWKHAGQILKASAARRKRRGVPAGRRVNSKQPDAREKRLSVASTGSPRTKTIKVSGTNMTSTLIANRRVNPARWIFSNGSPSKLTRTGLDGLTKAARIQLQYERRTIARRWDRAMQSSIPRKIS